MVRVADFIVSFLYDAGVHDIFMLTGGGAMHLNDAVCCNKKIHYVCQHHEQACAIAAEVYARVTGKIGAAMVTTGPASTNALTGVLGAWQDSVPCFYISGQSKRKEATINSGIATMRQIGVQEANIIPLVESITKYAVTVNEAEKIRYHLEKALYLATSGRPGPVWIDVPLDVQSSLINPEELVGYDIPAVENSQNNEKIGQFIDLLKKSRKPLLIAGNGIKRGRAEKEFLQFIRRMNIPVVTSNMAIDLLDYQDPLNIGMAGIKGQRAANIALQNADLLLCVGHRLSVPFIGYEYDKFAPQAIKVVVDVDEDEHKKKTIKFELFIQEDARDFFNEVSPKIPTSELHFKKNWVKNLTKIKKTYPVCEPAYKKQSGRMNMYYCVDLISDFLNKNDCLLADAGSAYYVVGQATKIKKGQQFVLPGATAPMGYGLPASTGAAVARKGKRVICITGDGSMLSNVHELATMVQYKLPIKIFVFENGGYLSIRNTQINFFDKRLIGESKKSGVYLPEMKKLAQTFGLDYFLAKNNQEFKKILPRVLSAKGPVLCELKCVLNQAIIPSVSSKKLEDGTMVSTSIDDMLPFLPEATMAQIKESLQ